MNGGHGDDEVFGQGGDDDLFGYRGDDRVVGGPGDDFIKGGSGSDVLSGNTGDDVVNGNADDDESHGNSGADMVMGHGGADVLFGGGGDDELGGGLGADEVHGGAGNDFASGGGGDDTVTGDGDDDRVIGGQGDDILRGGPGANSLGGGPGTDTCLGAEKRNGCELPVVNTAPTAVDDAATVAFDATVDIDVLANDSDPDGNEFFVVGVDLTGTLGSAEIAEDGSITYDTNGAFADLEPGTTATDSFGYVISDSDEANSSATVTVTVTRENLDPTVGDLAFTTDENTPVDFDVLAVASDPEGYALTIDDVINDVATKGSVFAPGGEIIAYDPDKRFEELDTGDTDTDRFDVVLSDPHGGSVTATVNVTITGVNDTPVAEDDAISTDEDSDVSGSLLDDNGSGPDSDIDGDELVIGSVGDTPVPEDGDIELAREWGAITVAADGSFTVALGPEADELPAGAELVDTFTYVVFDGNSSSTPATVTVTITGSNDAPVVIADAVGTDEDTPLDISPLDNDSDVDVGDELVIAADSLVVVGGGSVSLDESGTIVTFDPSEDFDSLAVGETAEVTVTYAATDGTAASQSEITITITGVNDAPLAEDDAISTDEDSDVSGNLLDDNGSGPDSDVDGDDLVVAGVGEESMPEEGNLEVGLSWGTLTVGPDGSFTVEPSPLANGLPEGAEATEEIEYVISDGNDTSSPATITVTINGTNDAPVAVNDEPEDNVTDEDTPLVVRPLANDTDPDFEDVLAIDDFDAGSADSAVSLQSSTELLIDPTGAYQYLDDGDQETDVVTYDVSDGNGGVDTGSLAVTITGVNDAPVVVDEARTTDENTAIDGLLLDNDSDVDADDELTLASLNGTAVGDEPVEITTTAGSTITVDDSGEFLFAPAPAHIALGAGQSTVETIPYTVTDGDAVVAGEIVITVEGLNNTPTTAADSAATDEDTPIEITPLDNDDDADADDDDELVIDADSIEVEGGGSVSVDESGTVLSFDPTVDHNALDTGAVAEVTVTYSATDGTASSSADIAITVTGVNDAPVTAPDAGEVSVGGSVVVNLLENDSDPEDHELAVTALDLDGITGQAGLTLDGDLSYATNGAFVDLAVGESVDEVIGYTVADEPGLTTEETVTITVVGVNEAPTAGDVSASTDEDTEVVIAVDGDDVDNDDSAETLIWSVTNAPAAGDAFVDDDGNVVFNPAGAFDALAVEEGTSLTFGITATDRHGATSAEATVSVDVAGVNDAPTADDLASTGPADVVLGIAPAGDDVDSDDDSESIGWVITTEPESGVAGFNEFGNLQFDAAGSLDLLVEGEEAVIVVGYASIDSHEATSLEATWTITVVGVNEAPVVVADAAATDEDTAVQIDVLDNDSDVDGAVELAAVDEVSTEGVALAIVEGQVSYDPAGLLDSLAQGDSLEDSFSYLASDGLADVPGAVTVDVTGVNDAPTAADAAGTGGSDEVIDVELVGDDIDTDDDAESLAWQVTTAPATGEVSIEANTASYDPAGAFDYLMVGQSAQVTFGVTASDGYGAPSAEALVTVTIDGVNNAPDAVDDAGQTDEDTAIEVDLLGNDSDIDTDDIALFGIDDSETTGSVFIAESGIVTYDPAGAFDDLAEGDSATDSFEYTITDGDFFDSAVVSITVDGVNDAPVAQDEEYEISVVGPITIGNVLDNDSDVDTGDVIEVSGLDLSATTGSVLSNGDGTFEYTATTLLVDGATDSFGYEITDGLGATATATVTISETDADDDGFGVSADCDDDEPTTYPGADEVPYDGVDQNCDDADEVDVDDDGHDADKAVGGTPDCDDTSATVYPGAAEVLDDEIDQNCDGIDGTVGGDSDGDGVLDEDDECRFDVPTVGDDFGGLVLDGGRINTVMGDGVPASTGDGCLASAARTTTARDITTFGGDIYLTELISHTIRRIDRETGIVSTVVGSGTAGAAADDVPATDATLDSPQSAIFDSTGRLYIADNGNGVIRTVDPATNLISSVTAVPQFIAGMALDGDDLLYFADARTTVWKVDLTAEEPTPVVLASGMNTVRDVALLPDGDVVAADSEGHRVWLIDADDGTRTAFAGTGSSGSGVDGVAATSSALNKPYGVDTDADGNVYIAGYWSHSVRVVDTDGIIHTLAGDGTATNTGDGGPAVDATIRYPINVHVDPDGTVWASPYSRTTNNSYLRAASQADLDEDGIPDFADDDVDGDGFEGDFGDGTDCNDADAGINPDAFDIPDDEIDQDCDGEDATTDGALGFIPEDDENSDS